MKIACSLLAVLMLISSSACSSGESSSSASPQAESTQLSAAQPVQESPSIPGAQSATAGPRLEGSATAVMQVNGKAITLELDGKYAPVTAGNFVDLVQRGVYDGTRFHRVVKTPQPFVAQGGDPNSKDPNVPITSLGAGNFIDPDTKRDRYIPLEITPSGASEPLYSQTFKEAKITSPPQLPHRKGAIAMARTPLPDSGSAQFYFALDQLDFLDGDYAVFGYVTDGMDVVEGIKQGDVIESVKITKGTENFKK